MSVLGSILIDNTSIEKIVKIIKRSHFYEKRNRIIYKTMLEMYKDDDQFIDLVTLSEYLLKDGKLEEIGGTHYLMDLMEATPTSTTIVHHAKIIRDNNLLRKLVNVGIQIQMEGQNNNITGVDLLKKAEQLVGFHVERELQSDVQNIQKLMGDFWEDITNDKKKDSVGLKTGFYDLDNKLSGMQDSDLIVLAARPSMGKTSLALNIADNVCVKGHVPTAIFSLESSAKQIAMRLISSRAQISTANIRTGNLTGKEWSAITRALAEILESPLFIDDTGGLTVLELKAKGKRLKNENDIKLIIIDYLGKLKSDVKAENMNYEVEYKVQAVKNLAKELDIPIILLCQLNRECEKRPLPIPKLSDLRSSGAIEQEADVIMFLYRAEEYAKNVSFKEDIKGSAELIIGKHRDGPTGKINLLFEKEFTLFKNRTDKYE